jgi:hypothetical protein
MSMGPLLKYRLSIDHYLSGIFARQQDATSTGGVCLGSRQFATPGDRIAMLFAAVHESGCGTFETCRRSLAMSVYWDRPEMLGAGSK